MKISSYIATAFKTTLSAVVLSAIAACGASPEQRQANLETRAQLNEVLANAALNKLAPLVPQCTRVLEGRAVDEAALVSQGFTKKQGLLGGQPFYSRTTRRAGIGRAAVMTQLAHTENGSECQIFKNRSVTDGDNLSIITTLLEREGYVSEGIERHRLGRRATFSKNGTRISFSQGSTDQYYTRLFLRRI